MGSHWRTTCICKSLPSPYCEVETVRGNGPWPTWCLRLCRRVGSPFSRQTQAHSRAHRLCKEHRPLEPVPPHLAPTQPVQPYAAALCKRAQLQVQLEVAFPLPGFPKPLGPYSEQERDRRQASQPTPRAAGKRVQRKMCLFPDATNSARCFSSLSVCLSPSPLFSPLSLLVSLSVSLTLSDQFHLICCNRDMFCSRGRRSQTVEDLRGSASFRLQA